MKKRVLLVDDEASIRRSLSLGLNQIGYDVDPCENGINALKKLDSYEKDSVNIDTIILDIQLPDIDGIKLGKMIKSKYPSASMVYITGYFDKLNQIDIEDLGDVSILQKPFEIEELTNKFKTSNIEDESEFVSTKSSSDTKKSVSSYMLVKIDKKADFFSIYRKLYFMDNVLYCDATKGEYDIFLLVQSDSNEDNIIIMEEKIKEIEGVIEVGFLEIGNPELDESMKEIIQTAEIAFSKESLNEKQRDMSKRVCSYVLLEVDASKLDEIYTILQIEENVVHCDFTNGKYNLVLLVHGAYFDEIHKLISNKISKLDGILKAKEYPVVNLFEM